MGNIKATRKYENPITFPETHKLFIDANHQPIIRGTDNAIWNRLHTVPFEVAIPASDIDKDLPEKLKAEAEGILAWAVAGGIRWSKDGLGKPLEVDHAGEQWRERMDPLKDFLQDHCEIKLTDPNTYVPATALFQAYVNWAEANSDVVLKRAKFNERLEALGCKEGRKEHGKVRVWQGIRFKKEGVTG